MHPDIYLYFFTLWLKFDFVLINFNNLIMDESINTIQSCMRGGPARRPAIAGRVLLSACGLCGPSLFVAGLRPASGPHNT